MSRMKDSTSRLIRFAVAAVLVSILVLLIQPRVRRAMDAHSSSDAAAQKQSAHPERLPTHGSRTPSWRAPRPSFDTQVSAEQIVAARMKQFAQSRREIMRAMARQKNIEVPALVERFFDALEGGDWAEIEAAFDAINGGESNAGHSSERLPEVARLWGPIIDAYGAAEQVHLWPAQKLLDYGNAVLGALRPGMVYVGGTDEGRWVPTLLNDTGEGERRIVITQNGLADGTYSEYIRFLYGDRFNALSEDDSRKVFADYIADAQKRMEHDQQFPNEPKQIRDNEHVTMVDGKSQVGGMVAVMDINQRLLRLLMEKNPDLSFALQESFQFKDTYPEALPLGPIMELGAQDQSSFTAERAAASVAYWRSVADGLASEGGGELVEQKSYSKLAVGQANLFAERGFTGPAEQTYRAALGILPSNTDAVLGLAGILERTGRAGDAQVLLDQFGRDYPKQLEALKRFRARGSITFSP
jgi:hypothetical protein